MKTQFICPGCQSTFKEAISSVDFTTKCPLCGMEVLITADPAEVEKASKEAAKTAEAAKREAERLARIEAERATKEAEQKAKAQAERVEAARREAEEKAKAQAERVALRKQEEENAKAVAWVGRFVKRICPHCGCEGTWELTVKPGLTGYVVRCQASRCMKNFTILLNPSDNMMAPLDDILDKLQGIKDRLPDILNELGSIKFLIGVLVVWLVVLPLICWAIIANFNK